MQATSSLQDIIERRAQTERIAQFLREELAGYLETLRPLLAPERFLGKKYLGAKGEQTWSDRSYAELQQEYKKFCGSPFHLRPELEADRLALITNRLELHPWEYSHAAKSDRETRQITMTSPVRWVLTYKADLTLAQLRQIMASPSESRGEPVRQFVANALMMQLAIARTPGIAQLLAALRYQVATESMPDGGNLPLVTITSVMPSYRPADEHLLAAIALSGLPAFIELIDLEAARVVQDPWKTRLEELMKS